MSTLLAPSPSVEPAIQNLRSLVDALQMAAIDGDTTAMADAVNDLHEAGWRLYEAVAGDCQPEPVVQAYHRPDLLRDALAQVLGQEKPRRETA